MPWLDEIYYLTKWIGYFDMEKKIRYHLNSYGRFKLMTCSNNCREQIFYRKNDCCWKEVFCSEQRSRFIFWRLTLQKSCKPFLQNICLPFDLLYHKQKTPYYDCSYGGIFKKILKNYNLREIWRYYFYPDILIMK